MSLGRYRLPNNRSELVGRYATRGYLRATSEVAEPNVESALIWKHLEHLPRPHSFHVRYDDNTLPQLLTVLCAVLLERAYSLALFLSFPIDSTTQIALLSGCTYI